MVDRYANFAQSGPGRALVRRLGLPNPPRLHRHRPGDLLISGPVLLGRTTGGRLGDLIAKIVNSWGADVVEPGGQPDNGREPLHAALVFDATGLDNPANLTALYEFFHPHARSLYPNGRVVVVGAPPQEAGSAAAATAQRALEGFVRSVGKEFGRGITAQLLQVSPGGEANIESTLRFFLSARSAYVSGQVVHIESAPVVTPADWEQPLADQVVVVTGAARGIGAAMAQVLARDGAQVVCVDRADTGDVLAQVANQIGGHSLQLDVTATDAPQRLVEHLQQRHGRLDAMVHNAGITRDRTIAKMDLDTWQSVLEVNLLAPARINEELLASDLVGEGGRLVGVSSISGIAGNRGQSNYATTKAGVIGLTQALASELVPRAITANAVAPGFIETPMTAAMPKATREVARRLNSMSQGGLPVDVAETVSWLVSPASGGVTGQVVRVCGQAMMGV